ncbi:NADH dehydrogenase [ubiquinone] 1 beta subcomplex subunit 6 isoform X1 [Gracilinanus agilis]|uniref:NADH dehydrogenase [ubiquinone] 1 beta subcomplex subunit 6 isoform X1 n=1 Tax=Gracilinanus agilis TaxID=191870 RepID=UPI001CFD514A|nr:NADH dehydrogenase [ubiquinone] 1 beta subcomplex subunit 6 isoform X1 [Gracilinanus agilis]
MTGYTPDEKLRLDQLRALRRQWLKDQELSPREPVLPPEKAFSGFWHRFLQKDSVWRRFAYKAYGSGMFLFVNLLIPAWIVHYYVKYHVETRPYGIVETKPKIFPGDTILETGEVIPPMKEHDTHNHH